MYKFQYNTQYLHSTSTSVACVLVKVQLPKLWQSPTVQGGGTGDIIIHVVITCTESEPIFLLT